MSVAYKVYHRILKDDLQRFLALLPEDREFDIRDWLQTLQLAQLRVVQKDATAYGLDLWINTADTYEINDLTALAELAYCAESDEHYANHRQEYECDDLLIGLAVAACIERLRRVGWVRVTDRLRLCLGGPRPYTVTKEGYAEGVWSEEPMVLWVLGFHLAVH